MKNQKRKVDFGEEGVPLEQFDQVHGFVPISFDRYVSLHVKANPTINRAEFAVRLRYAVDARKAGERCACGSPTWTIGSAEVGAACFTCITGEAWPDSDYEIDEVLGP